MVFKIMSALLWRKWKINIFFNRLPKKSLETTGECREG
jgi:hypothetical protein